jgi:uncharacterized circularly permuted ATP-grasp superfamily protein
MKVEQTSIEELKEAEEKARQRYLKLKEEVDELEKKELDKRTERIKPLVERAHKLMCQYNHTDGCGWSYEDDAKNPWLSSMHARWLDKFDKLINGDRYNNPEFSIEELEIFLDALEVFKKSSVIATRYCNFGPIGR